MGHEVIAYTQESDYMGAVDTTTAVFETPGADVTASEISLDNAAQRIRVPGQANPYATVFHNFEGALSISGTLTTGNTSWLQNVMAASASPYTFQIGQASSARWYLGVDPGAGVAERELMGVVFPQCNISVEQDDEATFELTGVYGDEQRNSTLTQGSPIQPTGDPLVFHGGDLSIPSATSLMLMQSATVSLNSQARLQRGWDRHPADAVMGGHESEVEFERIYKAADDLAGLAYGSTGSSAPQDYPTAASGTLDLTAPSGSMTITLGGLVPSEYSWNNAGNVNEDMMEGGTFIVNNPSIAVA